MWHVLFGDRNRHSGSWIAPRPRWMVVQPKTSETTDFDTITSRKGAPDGVEDFLYGDVGILHRQRRKTGGDGGDQISASHSRHSTVWSSVASHCRTGFRETSASGTDRTTRSVLGVVKVGISRSGGNSPPCPDRPLVGHGRRLPITFGDLPQVSRPAPGSIADQASMPSRVARGFLHCVHVTWRPRLPGTACTC